MESKSKHFARQFLREESLPNPFCPGCGNGETTNAFLKAVRDLGHKDLSEFAFVSGIGCGAWIPSPHFKADTLHTTHGRAIAFATDGSDGVVEYTWTATDMAEPASYTAQLWVSNGTNRYASDLIIFTVYDGPGSAP